MKIPGQQRKAISPIVATVLIIAATLIAAAAVLGYVFGIFGGASNTANISVTSVSIPHIATAGTGLAFSCTAGTLGDVVLSNTGSAAATVTSIVLTYGGSTYSAAVTGNCAVVGSGLSTTIYISAYPAATSSAGAAYNGYAVLNNGAEASLTGIFS